MRTETTQTTQTTAWGRSRFGGPALATAIPVGAVLALGLSAITFPLGTFPESPWLGFAVLAACVVSPMIGLAWIVVVDRSTIRGVTRNPEQSVEHTWYATAAAGAFNDLLIVLGLAMSAAVLLRWDPVVVTTLGLVLGAAFASVTVRYIIQSRRG